MGKELNIETCKADELWLNYFKSAEIAMDEQWNEIIWPLIKNFDFSSVLELAPGAGRNTVKLSNVSKEIHAVDLNEYALEELRKKSKLFNDCKVQTYVNNGYDLTMIRDSSISFVYSWDAVVHFDKAVVKNYIQEFARVLNEQGFGFIHHSTLGSKADDDITKNPGWRSNMTEELFKKYCEEYGLTVVKQISFNWGGVSDSISIFGKGKRKELLLRMNGQQSNLVKIRNKKWSDKNPLLSVIIPCFNYGHYIEQTIDSVLSQTFGNFEIIVVDGGSTDGVTPDILKKLKKPKIRIYFREGRHLVGSNRNYGIELAKGKYICCLDADDMIQPTYLEKALFFLEGEGYDVVGPHVQCFGGSTDRWTPQIQSFEEIVTIGNCVATTAIFKKEAWESVGGYKDWPVGDGHVPEDWEFWSRLMGYGYRFKNIPETLMLYRVHEKGLTKTCTTSHDEQLKTIYGETEYLLSEFYKTKREKSQNTSLKITSPYINLQTKKTKKRILLALPYVIIGGADTILLQIFNHLKEIYDITIITTLFPPANAGDNTNRFLEITKEFYHLKQFLSNDIEMNSFIDYLLFSKKIDLLMIVGSEFVYHMLPKIKKKYPALMVVDQLFNEFGHIVNNRKYAKLIDMNIVTSDLIKNILIDQYAEDHHKIMTIIHGVDTSGEFNPDKHIKKENSSERKSKLTVSYFGRMSNEKNPLLIIEIAKYFKDYDIQFNSIGNGYLYEELIQKIQSEKLEANINAPGFVESIKDYLYGTDIVLITSKIEGIPIIILEAMSFKKIVISSSVGGIPSIIKDGVNGYLCEHDDIDCFVSKINFLYNDRDLINKISQKARTFAIEHLDVDLMNGLYKETIENLLIGEKHGIKK